MPVGRPSGGSRKGGHGGAFRAAEPGQCNNSRRLAGVPHPAHIEPTDLDGDGRPDFVIADLGSQEPADHSRGQVVWLHQRTSDGEWRPVVLADGLGRVADVQPADVDGDGDLDLIAAEFGWRTTGRILLLEQTGIDADGQPALRSVSIAVIVAMVRWFAIMQLLQFGTAEAWMTIRPLAQLAGFNAPPRGRYNAPNDTLIRLQRN